MISDRKGLSTVVTTLIIILLVLVAIGIVWVVVQNLIEEGAGQAEGGVDCITTQVSIDSAEKVDTSSPADGTNDAYKIVLSRGGSGLDTITKVALVFEDADGETETVKDVAVEIGKLGKDTAEIAFTHADLGDIDGTATKVSVALMVDNRICDPSSTKTID